MSTYTITLSTEQDEALSALLLEVNTGRATAKPALPAITVGDYIQKRASEVANSYADQRRQKEEASVIAAYKLADTTKRNQVKTSLGI